MREFLKVVRVFSTRRGSAARTEVLSIHPGFFHGALLSKSCLWPGLCLTNIKKHIYSTGLFSVHTNWCRRIPGNFLLHFKDKAVSRDGGLIRIVKSRMNCRRGDCHQFLFGDNVSIITFRLYSLNCSFSFSSSFLLL